MDFSFNRRRAGDILDTENVLETDLTLDPKGRMTTLATQPYGKSTVRDMTETGNLTDFSFTETGNLTNLTFTERGNLTDFSFTERGKGTNLAVVSSNPNLTVQNNYTGVKENVGVETETLTYVEGTWKNSQQQPVQLSDYDLAITSGTPVANDTLGLTYTTALDSDISYRLPLVSSYSGAKPTVGTETETLTYGEGTWTASTLPASALWTSVCYGNGKFIALANGTDKAAYSIDGVNWTSFDMPSTEYWYSLCYGNGKFVSTMYNPRGTTNKVACSTDGLSWTVYENLPTASAWPSVCYGNGKYVAVAYDAGIAAYSTDGINWTTASMPSGFYCMSVCYGKGKFVAVGMSTGRGHVSAYSTDGINWTLVESPLGVHSFYSVCYGDDKFVAVATPAEFIYSTDGLNWTAANRPDTASYASVCYGGGKFVATSVSSNKAAYSMDGINWTATTLPSSGDWCLTCYGNGKHVAIAQSSNNATYLPSNTWYNSQQQEVQLSDYQLSTTATPLINDIINLTYVTTAGQDISSRLPIQNNYTGTKPTAGTVTNTIQYIEGKVKQASCSDYTTWYLTGNGDLYGCGRNNNNQQGDGTTNNITTFTKRAENVAQIAYSGNTTWYVDKDGKLYGCGMGSYGQQGNNASTNVTTFTQRATNVAKVACSDNTTWYIDNNGNLYGCGYNNKGQQGSGQTGTSYNVLTFTQRATNVADVYCTGTTTWYLTTSGDLYGCGDNNFGQQGDGTTDSVATFTLRASNVEKAICSNATTWYIGTNGNLYGCGQGSGGQQGTGANSDVLTFSLKASNVADIVCSPSTTWYVTTSGDLYGCGNGYYGQQGSGSSTNVNTFTLRASNVEKVSCGFYTTWYINEDGELYGCGQGSYGQQGNEATTNVTTFTKRADNVSDIISTDYATWYLTDGLAIYGCGQGSWGQQGTGATNNVTVFTKKSQSLNWYEGNEFAQLNNYGLTVTSGTPVAGDTLVLTYVTTSTDISSRLVIEDNYTGTKGTIGTETETLTYVEGLGAWVESTLPSSSASWNSICYGNGKFVAIGYGASSPYTTDQMAYSTDGINWTISTLPSSQEWYSVCYGNGKFVAIASSTDQMAYSTDGINWTISTLPSSQDWTSVCYGNGKFVAIAHNSSTVIYSTDGINWSSSTLPSSQSWQLVCYGNGKFVAIEYYSGIVVYSTDGITWLASTLPSTPTLWYSLCYGNDKFVATGGGPSSTSFVTDKAAYSTDGVNWSTITLPSSQEWYSVCYGNGKFVTIARNSDKVAYSTDGINWTESTMPSSGWYSLCYGSGKFVATAYSGKVACLQEGTWQNSQQQSVQLSDYDLEITSGTPQIGDVLTLTYVTTGGDDISDRLILVDSYVGPELTLGSKQVILTYNNSVWKNNQNQTVTLADYQLAIASGTPQNGDTITLNYNTTSGDISSRLTVTSTYSGVKPTTGVETVTLTYVSDGTTPYFAYQEPISDTIRYIKSVHPTVGETVYTYSSSTMTSSGTIGSVDNGTFYLAGEGVGILGPYGRNSANDKFIEEAGSTGYWIDENNNVVTLSDYNITTSGTLSYSDYLVLTYTTLGNQNISSRLVIANNYTGHKSEDGIVTDVLTYEKKANLYGWGDANGWSQYILNSNGTAGVSDLAVRVSGIYDVIQGSYYHMFDNNENTRVFIYKDCDPFTAYIDLTFKQPVSLNRIQFLLYPVSSGDASTIQWANVKTKENASDDWTSQTTTKTLVNYTEFNLTFNMASSVKYYRIHLVSTGNAYHDGISIKEINLFPWKYFTTSITPVAGSVLYNGDGVPTGLGVLSYSAENGLSIRKTT